MEEIQIYGDFIQLDQFLKKTDRMQLGRGDRRLP